MENTYKLFNISRLQEYLKDVYDLEISKEKLKKWINQNDFNIFSPINEFIREDLENKML